MSKNEYDKVKWAVGYLLRKAEKEIAAELDFVVFWKEKSKDDDAMRDYYTAEAARLFDDFAACLEALYPGDRRRLNDHIQYIDELTAELGEGRARNGPG